MIDIHSHILPGLDDGAADLSVSLEMARAYVDQGVTCVACTPHILPGIYHNTGPAIREAVAALSERLAEAGLSLRLVAGADNHMVTDFVPGLQSGKLLSIADTPYVLVEPPHHVAPTRMEDLFFNLMVSGYIPVLTHPERLTWIEDKYDIIQHLAHHGVWMQITAGSVLGRFGSRPRYWADRMMSEGLVHVVASDAHNMSKRPPDCAAAFDLVSRQIGAQEAQHLFVTRPAGIVSGCRPHDMPAPQRWDLDEHIRDQDDAPAADHTDASLGFADRLRRFFAR